MTAIVSPDVDPPPPERPGSALPGSPPPARVLVVCTGNIHRSPMVEALLRDRLRQRGVAAVISSAGVVEAGRPASDEVLELLKARGIDARDHRSSVLDADRIAAADLVLAMARDHVRAVSMEVPGAFAKTFTLRELVRRGQLALPRGAHESMAAWLDRIGADREPRQLLGSSAADDIEDPNGRRFKAFKKMAVDLDGLVPTVADLAFPDPV
jgi:protein-tyrosine phosphatase